jgi:hypothetical protein
MVAEVVHMHSGAGKLRNEFSKRSGVRDAILLQNKIFVTVIFDWVSVGVEQGGPPVSDGARADIAIFWITYITTRDLEFSATTADDNIRPF